MFTTSRRRFICHLVVAGGGAALSQAHAQSGPPHVDENDEQSIALGYRHDTTKVDAKRYPNHVATQSCGSCAFFQGKVGDEWGGCAMFGRKHVARAGWCQAWAKIA